MPATGFSPGSYVLLVRTPATPGDRAMPVAGIAMDQTVAGSIRSTKSARQAGASNGLAK